MASVFLSYRRGDSEGQARALKLALSARLGRDAVFMDVDNVTLGRDFRDMLSERLSSCDLFLALIGRDWLEATDAAGKRRLDDPHDYVRLEIAAALKRNIPVTPVLVQGVSMPPPELLPDDIRDVVFRQGIELRHDRWEADVDDMVRRLGLHPTPSRPYLRYSIGAVVLLALAFLVWLWLPRSTTIGPPVRPIRRVMGPLEPRTNRDKHDLVLDAPVVRTANECSRLCAENERCVAMTFVFRGEDDNRTGTCWLKDDAGTPTSNPYMISAVKQP